MQHLKLVIWLSWLSFVACNVHGDRETNRFMVAGHSYGNPVEYQSGFYPLFWASLREMPHQDVSFGVLTGDVVPRGSLDNWETVTDQIDSLAFPVFITPGNHDLIDPELFKKYGGPLYQSFEQNGDLFLLLNSNEGWNISGEQWQFFTEKVQAAEGRIFIFAHHVLWWTPEGDFSDVRPNWFESRAEDVNFHSEVLPVLKDCGREVYMFAGDVGALKSNKNLYYDIESNVHFIASGMGNGVDDHYLIVTVNPKSVSLAVQPLCTGCASYVLGDN